MSLDARQAAGKYDASAGNAAISPDVPDIRAYVVDHIDEALENGWIVPYYQPVIRTLTGKLCGFEALARWEDPVFGLLSPLDFIGSLEDAKLIHKLDCRMIREVCHHVQMCVASGNPVVPVSLNLSRLDFDLCDILEVIEKTVHEFEVPREMVNIEITESVFGADPTYMAMMVRRFHDVGYQVWMDDFGSGYSTLNALKDFDFDELKIDMEFLNRFGEKSKTILASVVDMAKKLGIQTLAEGVETEEHRAYLRRIGCEKMQGYLYGRPLPYDLGRIGEFQALMGIETAAERDYMTSIGSINTLSMSERDFTAGAVTHDYVTSMPLAIAEYDGKLFRVIDSNGVFRECLANVGIRSIEEAEKRVNDSDSLLGRTLRKLMDTIEEDRFARQDFVIGDTVCVMRARYIASSLGKKAVLVSIDDTIEQSERKRHTRMNESLAVLYSIYEHVDIIHLDEKYVEPVFNTAGFHTQFDTPNFDDATAFYARTDVYSIDRERYIAFMDYATMIERIRESGDSYIVDFFRFRQYGGDFVWKLVGLIHLADRVDNQVLFCIRRTHWANEGLFQEVYDGSTDDVRHDWHHADLRLTDGSLWRAISHDESLGLFWKDRDRRFVGANQKFLDYYGFKSTDDLLGKNDEDMGWHINPLPFMEDELRVLNEGICTRDVVGQCIVRGEVRDIVATKRPVYRNGRIVGLVGYFEDIAERFGDADDVDQLPLRDSVTGLLNFTGLESATWKFVDSYVKLGIDFVMISVNVENYQRINEELGYEFGEKVLARVGETLREVAGRRSAIGHVFAERFVILAQDMATDDLDKMCEDIESEVSAISHIDGRRCTVYVLAGYARYSDHHDIEAMKRHNRDVRLARKKELFGDAADSDIATPSLH